MLPSRLGCPLSLETANMGNTGSKMDTGTTVTSICCSQICINPEANND